MSIGAIIQTASLNIIMILVSRVIIGLGNGRELSTLKLEERTKLKNLKYIRRRAKRSPQVDEILEDEPAQLGDLPRCLISMSDINVSLVFYVPFEVLVLTLYQEFLPDNDETPRHRPRGKGHLETSGTSTEPNNDDHALGLGSEYRKPYQSHLGIRYAIIAMQYDLALGLVSWSITMMTIHHIKRSALKQGFNVLLITTRFSTLSFSHYGQTWGVVTNPQPALLSSITKNTGDLVPLHRDKYGQLLPKAVQARGFDGWMAVSIFYISLLPSTSISAMPSVPLMKRDSSATSSSSNSGTSAQVVVGVVLGAVVLLLFIAFVAWFFKRYRRRRRNPPPSSPNVVYNPKLSRVSDIGRLLEPEPPSRSETKAVDSRPLLSPEPFHTKVDSSHTWVPSGIHYPNAAPEEAYHIEFDRLPTPTFSDKFGEQILSSSLMEESSTPYLQSSFGSRHTSPQTSPPATPPPVPGPKSLPQLIIPGKDSPAIPASRYLLTRPIAKMETPIESPPMSSSSSVSSESLYSQASASTRRHTMLSVYEVPPPVPPIPFAFRSSSGLRALPQIPDHVLKRARGEEQKDELHRMSTKVIASLVKGRVKRTKGADLDRYGSRVSRIERADSIKSIATSSDEEEETTSMSMYYPRLERTRRRWEKRTQARMDTVMETSSPPSPDANYTFNVSTSPLRVRKNSLTAL
ncbi:uncharacterized protein BT62DRAFT_1012188 [Guyanagaster necrorhizus]|uniref:Uncharacterized protein n=1 Tax=Guyanagaster necrorhizus TaxID=856835 RepID=A0A9P7VIG9_9AGAR|nr:uncharacterized protein BT62DRAFT_1012188 [Guyanagaster necrorhizus MCA 3950]KAG7440970.1 hypothetical protein BT62DRAFT_1012188 [Guyanagaster necrorhizus MCA 3950]